MLSYISVCSGIEAATVAWEPLGFEPIFFAETDTFPSALLQYRYPEVPNLGDITEFKAWPDPGGTRPSLLVGGTPCQSFSVAGLRKGLADPRGNLALTYLAIADRYRPRWLVWENVPGVLSAHSHVAPDPRPPGIDLDGGDGPADGTEVVVIDEYDADEDHALACFLAGLQELGYGFAYRVLDAQYFGLAQRRARVFVVGYLGDWRPAAAVLLERESLSWHSPPRRDAREGAAAGAEDGIVGSLQSVDGKGPGNQYVEAGKLIPSAGDLSHCLNAGAMGRQDYESETLIAMQDVSGALRASAGAARMSDEGIFDQPIILSFSSKDSGADAENDLAPTLRAAGHDSSRANAGAPPAVAFSINAGGDETSSGAFSDEMSPTLNSSQQMGIGGGMRVRRLMPRECERLQGFPDDYTLVPGWEADGPRYRALGNSMAVPVMRWIGERIKLVEEIMLPILGKDAE